MLFKDLNRAATDLLSRDFAHERPWEVELTCAAKNPAISCQSSVNPGIGFDSTAVAKYAADVGSIEAKLGKSNAVIDTQYKPTNLENVLFGCRFDRRFNSSKGISDSLDLFGEYGAGSVQKVRFSVNPFLTTWNLCGTRAIEAGNSGVVRVGGELTGATDIRNVKLSVGASLTQRTKDLSWVLAVRTWPAGGLPFGKFSGTVHARSPQLAGPELAAEVTHHVADAKTDIAFGGLWYLDKSVSGRSDTYVKAKMTHDAQVAMSITHRLSDVLSGTFGAKIDMLKGAESVQYGMKINLLA